ncbi:MULTISPECIES: tRNA adenosine deaminase-associated protein [Corynebacterium]|uniref:tRNA adenosine deaminase-associated protein n=1 Tax=Corynebacterium TaxID=1716 RepID=UPI00124C068D|nr:MULTISPECIES: tRNA adenosine deaminase-associated protein [Corynebacterium]MBV7282231.1 tRNA adenosine deaminase-associated protein [Corynebacterium sp. TAE3-ERU30]MBV7302428.1 tRNA adenosine deaminase-associated protein [Corynebacterium sp. TAE3-ERU2]
MSADRVDFSVVVTLNNGQWQVQRYKDDFESLDTSIAAVRSLRAEGPAFALLCSEDDYFIIVRPTPSRVFALLSDATYALDDDLAEDVLNELGIDLPDLDEDELDDVDPWAEGDFTILEDVGLSEQVMDVILDDDELWPSEAVMKIAEELGFEEQLADATGLELS